MQLLRENGSNSQHFFVTLYYLRSLAISLADDDLKDIDYEDIFTDPAKQFCIQQCFYSQRGLHHLQDITRLVFAGAIYIIYSPRIDKDLVMAIIEVITESQQLSGNWPATHPIIRDKKDPWYITSHEIALCLTWIYFQPRVPDVARSLLLQMMEKYFTKRIIPTYQRDYQNEKEYKGWFDEALNGQKVIAGWAAGIVCHFLANYHAVLNDHINRRVIESLKLQSVSDRYLIDETANDKNPKWQMKCFSEGSRTKRPIWFDLPQFSWAECNESMDIANQIRAEWTDPTTTGELSDKIAHFVLAPIQRNRLARPKGYVAGVLGGAPGTRKTSLVRIISEILEWPQISVPASVIFEKGFDQTESQASYVFRLLNYLTGCVIFFDEFEEFLRKREYGTNSKEMVAKNLERVCKGSISNRTIAAFTTSAMLPRFQDLNSGKRSLIFLATNDSAGIDEAIIRPGRFDFKENIDHPKIERFTASTNSYLDNPTERQKNVLKSIFVDSRYEDLDKIAVDIVKSAMNHKSVFHREIISFRIVEKALKASAKKLRREVDSNNGYYDDNNLIVTIREFILDELEKFATEVCQELPSLPTNSNEQR